MIDVYMLQLGLKLQIIIQDSANSLFDILWETVFSEFDYIRLGSF